MLEGHLHNLYNLQIVQSSNAKLIVLPCPLVHRKVLNNLCPPSVSNQSQPGAQSTPRPLSCPVRLSCRVISCSPLIRVLRVLSVVTLLKYLTGYVSRCNRRDVVTRLMWF